MQRAEIRVIHMRRRRHAGMGPAPSCAARSRTSTHPRSATHVAAYPTAMESPNSTSLAAATGAHTSALTSSYAPHHPGVPLRNGSAGDTPRGDHHAGRSSDRNANGSPPPPPSPPHTVGDSSSSSSWLWCPAWPLVVGVGEMESERSGVEREAGLGFREAMGGGGEARGGGGGRPAMEERE
ncbi:Os06g0712250 [Oryza sativa Japonica Group]|uniref:Os06g0712250 protein n=1 Tax=Oryza sativa subsp. japonica TaxID=39947 RepID=A0A0P0X1E3_ORYSJ|nr:Os06g0712250 [Oryza sativa Japonica Group]